MNTDSEPLEVFTAQYEYRGEDRLDISRKGGDVLGVHFSPRWADIRPVLLARRDGRHADAERLWPGYVASYLGSMRHCQKQFPWAWEQLLSRPRVTLVCFCRESERCHRSVLARYLGTLGLGVQVRGERPPRQVVLPGLV